MGNSCGVEEAFTGDVEFEGEYEWQDDTIRMTEPNASTIKFTINSDKTQEVKNIFPGCAFGLQIKVRGSVTVKFNDRCLLENETVDDGEVRDLFIGDIEEGDNFVQICFVDGSEALCFEYVELQMLKVDTGEEEEEE